MQELLELTASEVENAIKADDAKVLSCSSAGEDTCDKICLPFFDQMPRPQMQQTCSAGCTMSVKAYCEAGADEMTQRVGEINAKAPTATA